MGKVGLTPMEDILYFSGTLKLQDSINQLKRIKDASKQTGTNHLSANQKVGINHF